MTDPKDAERLADPKCKLDFVDCVYSACDCFSEVGGIITDDRVFVKCMEEAWDNPEADPAAIIGRFLRLLRERTQERDDYRADYLRIHKDKIDYLERNIVLEKERDEAIRELEDEKADTAALAENLVTLDRQYREASHSAEALKTLLQRAADKLCHYATDYPQPNTLSIINACDRALKRGHYSDGRSGTQPTPDDVERALEVATDFVQTYKPYVANTPKFIELLAQVVAAALAAARRENPELRALLLSPEIIEIGAKAACDRHVGSGSVWDSPIIDKEYRLRDMRAALEAIVRATAIAVGTGAELRALDEAVVIRRCAEHLDELAIDIRDNSPRGKEGLITALAGAHAGALFDAATSLRALAARDAALNQRGDDAATTNDPERRGPLRTHIAPPSRQRPTR